MKRSMKKILSVVLALVMVFSLSVTAFATETAAPKIVVTVATTEESYVEEYTAAAGITLEAAVNTYLKDLEPQWISVADWEDPQITHRAMTELDGLSTTPAASNDATKALIVAKYTDDTFQQWVSGYTGYAQLASKTTDPAAYHYVYAGYAWTYTSSAHMTNGEYDYIDSYMCCYTLSADETIYLTYKLTITDWYTNNAL